MHFLVMYSSTMAPFNVGLLKRMILGTSPLMRWMNWNRTFRNKVAFDAPDCGQVSIPKLSKVIIWGALMTADWTAQPQFSTLKSQRSRRPPHSWSPSIEHSNYLTVQPWKLEAVSQLPRDGYGAEAECYIFWCIEQNSLVSWKCRQHGKKVIFFGR